jgi:hypothetical protein
VIKASLVIMTVLTVLISIGLRWRDQRVDALRPVARREGWIAAQKRKANRWVTAAALAAVFTLLVLGGLHWLKVLQQ